MTKEEIEKKFYSFETPYEKRKKITDKSRRKYIDKIRLKDRLKYHVKNKKSQEYKLDKRNEHLLKYFNMTIGEYQKLFEIQNGLCEICKQPETAKRNGKIKRLAVDHDHNSNKVRGLLCQSCNTMLGKGRDSINLLKSAINYLEKYIGREI